jgi:hypothetical protein
LSRSTSQRVSETSNDFRSPNLCITNRKNASFRTDRFC